MSGQEPTSAYQPPVLEGDFARDPSGISPTAPPEHLGRFERMLWNWMPPKRMAELVYRYTIWVLIGLYCLGYTIWLIVR